MIERLFEIISRTPTKPEHPFMGELPSAVQELKFTRMGLLDHAVQGIEVPTASLPEILPVNQVSTPNTKAAETKQAADIKNTVELVAEVKENKAVATGYDMTKETADQADLAAAARQAMIEQYSQAPQTKPVVPQG